MIFGRNNSNSENGFPQASLIIKEDLISTNNKFVKDY